MKKIKELINKHPVVFICLMTFISTLALYTNLNIISNKNLTSVGGFARLLERISKSLSKYSITTLISFVLIFSFYNKKYFKTKFSKAACFLSIFISIMYVVGYSYYKTNTWNIIFISKFQFVKSFIVIIGYYFIYYILIKTLYEYLDNVSSKEKINNKKCENKKILKIYNFIFEKHPFIVPLIIILISWLPYLIFYYPGVTPGGDTKSQLYMYYGLPNPASNTVVLMDDNMYITNHHPVLHTLLLSGCMEVGINLFKSYYFGFFIYTIIQTIVLALVLSYSFVLLKKWKAVKWVRILSLLIYCLLSFFPFFAMTASKDTYFAITVYILTIYIFEFVKNNEIINNKKYYLSLMLILLLMMLFRNDGIYRGILTFIIVIIFNRKLWKKLLLIISVPTVIYLIYLNVLLPIFKIPNGSVAEMLSIPFQQTARVVYVHGVDAYEKKDTDKIRKILPEYDDFKKNYSPTISDPIKNHYNKYATTKDLKEYFKVWFKYLFKYPTDYIQATLNNTYGYFYTDRSHNIGYTDLTELDDEIFNLKLRYNGIRKVIYNYHLIFRLLPIIGLFYSVGFYNLLLLVLVGYLCTKNKYKYIVVLVPLLMVLLINLASPVNGHWRYTLPTFFTMPIVISVIMYVAYSEKSKNMQYIKEKK